jgi:hypothetical protein
MPRIASLLLRRPCGHDAPWPHSPGGVVGAGRVLTRLVLARHNALGDRRRGGVLAHLAQVTGNKRCPHTSCAAGGTWGQRSGAATPRRCNLERCHIRRRGTGPVVRHDGDRRFGWAARHRLTDEKQPRRFWPNVASASDSTGVDLGPVPPVRQRVGGCGSFPRVAIQRPA